MTNYTNTSAHTSISVYINCVPTQRKDTKDKSQRIEKDTTGVWQYSKLAEHLKQANMPIIKIDLAIQQVTQTIKHSVRAAFPVKTVKIKGLNLKISQTTLSLVNESQHFWMHGPETYAGSPRGDHTLFKHKKKLKEANKKTKPPRTWNRQEKIFHLTYGQSRHIIDTFTNS